jgi:hypothetical protein
MAYWSTSNVNFSPVRAPAFGGFDLDVDAYGLDPDLNYTVTFSAPGVNGTTNSLTVPVNFTVAGYKQVARSRVRVLGWEFPLATSIATLHEVLPSGGLHEIPVIIPDGEVNATVFYEFTQILNGKSHTNIPPVGCRGACWPYQFSAYGKGFLTTGEKVRNSQQSSTSQLCTLPKLCTATCIPTPAHVVKRFWSCTLSTRIISMF